MPGHSDLELGLRVQCDGWFLRAWTKPPMELGQRDCVARATHEFHSNEPHPHRSTVGPATLLGVSTTAQPHASSCGHHPSPYLSRCRFCRPFCQVGRCVDRHLLRPVPCLAIEPYQSRQCDSIDLPQGPLLPRLQHAAPNYRFP